MERHDLPQMKLTRGDFHDASFFFSSAKHTLVGHGVKTAVDEVIPFDQLATQAKQLLEAAKTDAEDNPVLFGVIPFDQSFPTKLLIPNRLNVADRCVAQADHQVNRNPASITSDPSGDHYRQGVSQLVTHFGHSKLDKAVLSRALDVEAKDHIDRFSLLNNLLSINQSGYTFSVQTEDNRYLLGASPELLIAKQGAHIVSNPLAGSRPKADNEAQNQRLSDDLLATHKDRHEHALVVDEIENVLAPHCQSLDCPKIPSVIKTNTMLHLSTCLNGQLSDPSTHVLQLASQLHPTPAVCGFPRNEAYQAIKLLEGFERGYFTGMVGWCDAEGNGEWVVTIRCAEVNERKMRLFAGAGIVDQSNPQAELEETAAKMQTIINAAGLAINEPLIA